LIEKYCKGSEIEVGGSPCKKKDTLPCSPETSPEKSPEIVENE